MWSISLMSKQMWCNFSCKYIPIQNISFTMQNKIRFSCKMKSIKVSTGDVAYWNLMNDRDWEGGSGWWEPKGGGNWLRKQEQGVEGTAKSWVESRIVVGTEWDPPQCLCQRKLWGVSFQQFQLLLSSRSWD